MLPWLAEKTKAHWRCAVQRDTRSLVTRITPQSRECSSNTYIHTYILLAQQLHRGDPGSIEDSMYFRNRMKTMARILSWCLLVAAAFSATTIISRTSSVDPLAGCPGYKASNVKTTSSSLTADLSLAGRACNVYGDDLTSLTLQVVYETGA